MSLKPVAFNADIKHSNIAIHSNKQTIKKPPLKKKFNFNFTDSESYSENDEPIPYLKRHDPNELHSDDDEIKTSPTQIRKSFKRPIPPNRKIPANRKIPENNPTRRSNTYIRRPSMPVTTTKLAPKPPNRIRDPSPPNKDQKKPGYIRKIKKTVSTDENMNNWTKTQKHISPVKKPKISLDDSYTYSEDEQSYNTSSHGYYSDDYNDISDDNNNIEAEKVPSDSPQKKPENLISNGIDDATKIETEKGNESTQENKQIINKIQNILDSQINTNSTDASVNSNESQTQPAPSSADQQDSAPQKSEEDNQSICYFMDRKYMSKFSKSKLCMTLNKGSNALISQVMDVRDESFQINYNDQLYTVLMESSQCSFSLRKGEFYGDEIFSILYNVNKNASKQRSCVLNFFSKFPGLPNRMHSIQPELNADGIPTISFGYRQVIPSVKNMKFLDENEKEILAVMKIGKTQLCIEALPAFPEVIIFVIGIAAFLNHS